MKREALVFLASGTLFGLIVGWMLGTQQPAGSPPAAAAVAPAGTAASAGATPPPLDEVRVQDLMAAANRDPADAAPRVALGNVYFDAERFAEAITWYEASLAIDPQNVDVSTDLGVSYYYTNQPERAIEQFAYSLEVDDGHVKTMLNLGIVRAFGLQDLAGAAEAWERVMAIAPESPEGRAAQQALESLRSAHSAEVGTPQP
jgi:tetratricopeptide (TPR) repeat protein